MTYTPPAANAVSFNFVGAYTPPTSTAVNLAFGASSTTAALTGAQATTRAGSVTFANGLVQNLTGARVSTRAGVVFIDDDVTLVGAKCTARAGAFRPVGSTQRQYVFDVIV